MAKRKVSSPHPPPAKSLRPLSPGFGPLVSPAVGKPLADHALQKLLGRSRVDHAIRRALAVAEIELCDIAVQVAGNAVLADVIHSAAMRTRWLSAPDYLLKVGGGGFLVVELGAGQD